MLSSTSQCDDVRKDMREYERMSKNMYRMVNNDYSHNCMV